MATPAHKAPSIQERCQAAPASAPPPMMTGLAQRLIRLAGLDETSRYCRW
jgi:hypothetical protein